MGCQNPIYLKDYESRDLVEYINQSFELATELFTDDEETVPMDLTGYVGRGAISSKDRTLVVPFTYSIVGNLITASLTVQQVQALTPETPYYYDHGADLYSGPTIVYTLPIFAGIIVFNQSASRAV